MNTIELFNDQEDLEWMSDEIKMLYNSNQEWEAWIKKAMNKMERGFLEGNEELLDYALDRNDISNRNYARDLIRDFISEMKNKIDE